MIQLADVQDHRAWNDFLEKEKEKQLITIAHNPSLGKILAKTFGYKDESRVIKSNGKMIGVFPAVRVGKKLVSMPHFSYGGPVVDASEEVQLCLKKTLGQQSFEARGFSKWTNHRYDKKVTAIVYLNDDPAEQLKGLKGSFRRKLRKASEQGFQIRHGGIELLDDFYMVYTKKMHQKGSPPLGKVFFRNLLTDYDYGAVQITAAYKDGRVAAAGFTLAYLGFNELCWVSSYSAYDKYNVNSYLYWNIIKDSIAKGYTCFSMGRSTKDSSNHRYKRQWNPTEFPVFYNYSEPVGTSIKEFTFLTKLWKLQPLRTSVFFGHYISKYVY